MDSIVILHSKPKSQLDLKLLSLSKSVISFISKNDLSADLQAVLSNKVIYLSDQDIYDARERSKEIWNTRIVNDISKRSMVNCRNSYF